jgi:RHS repeat-associated protein
VEKRLWKEEDVMKNKSFFTFLICLVLAAYTQAYTPEYDNNGQLTLLIGDLNRNGDISMTDIGLLASAWLEQDCGISNPCNGADVFSDGGDGNIDLKDFATMAGVFGECTDPTNPACTHVPLTLYEPPGEALRQKKTFAEKLGGFAKGVASVGRIQPFSGEFIESTLDMHVPGRELDFVWARTYRSRTGSNTAMGNRWDFSYNIRLEPYSGTLLLHDGAGRKDIYSSQPDGTWVADGFFEELTQEADGSLTLTFPDTGTWSFRSLAEANAPGKISEVIDRNGNTISYEYDAQGRLTRVRDTTGILNDGRLIAIAYNADGFIETITDWTGRQIQYAYYDDHDPNGSAGDLKSVTTPSVTGTPTGNDFPLGKTTTYTYSKGFADERLNHNLLTITDPKGQVYVQNTYSNDPTTHEAAHVVQQRRGGPNDIINYTYLPQAPDAGNNYTIARTITNDRVGNVTEHFFGNRNQLLMLRQYTGRADTDLPTSINPDANPPTNKLRSSDPDYFETRYQYNSEYLPTQVDYPNGNYVTNVYEIDIHPDAAARSRGNLRETHRYAGSLGGDQTQIDESFEYNPNFNFITRYTDARGNETLYDYDPNGNRIRTEYIRPSDPNIVHQWQYNGFGQVTDHNLPDNGNGSKRKDSYSYYSNLADPHYGYLKDVVIDADNFALTTTYEYDAVGNVIGITDPNGNDTQFIYNQLNQVVRRISHEVTGSSGVRYESDTHYDENDNVVRVDIRDIDDHGILQPDPNITTIYEYDLLDRLIRTTAEVDDGNSVVTEYEYDDNSNLILTRSGEATNGNQPDNVVRTLYDERDMLFQVIRAEGDSNHSTTQYDYDGNGNIISVHEGLEDTPHTTTSQYDGYNRRINVIDPMENVTEYHYDPTGNVISKRIDGELTDIVGDANNVCLYESSYEYDALNRLTYSIVSFFDPNTQVPIDDGNSITEFQYSDNSQMIQVIDDNGKQTRYEYDTVNRKSVVTDAKDNMTSYAYDKNSNIIEVNEIDISDLAEPNEIFVTTYVYDNLDRLIRVTDNNSNTTEYGYDSRGNRRRVTDALNNETRYEYDYLSRLTRTIRDMDGDGADAADTDDIKTSRTYDDNSRLIEQTDNNGNATSYEYDALNRMVRTTYADGTSETSTYDVHDDQAGFVAAVGTIFNNMGYDKMHRLTRATCVPGPGVSSDPNFVIYQYDGMSRMVYAENNNSVVTRRYDSLSNIVRETLNGETTTSTYDGLGNKRSCTYPGGKNVTNNYDSLNQLSTTSADGTLVGSYDYIGRRVRRLSYGNGSWCNYSYDDLKRITSTANFGGGTIVDERTYSWDAMHNKTQRKDERIAGPQLTHDYSYDALNRLIDTSVTDAGPVRNTDYLLDGVGNRTLVLGTPDAGLYEMNAATPIPADFHMNQYTNTPFDDREYDENGNLSASTALATSLPVLYMYDVFDRLVEVDDIVGGRVTTYSYDAFGRRIQKVVDSGGTLETTRYFYDGGRVIEEQDDTGTTQATYVYGNYIDEVLNMQRGTADTPIDYYYHTDDMYNVMAVTDSAGTVVERYEYGDYGEPKFFDGTGVPLGSTAIDNPYLFNGRRYDPETSWYYYRTRYLDPRAGRFVSRDTIGIWGDSANLGNATAYVGNNPWTFTDPMGFGGGDPLKGLNVDKGNRLPCGCLIGAACGSMHSGSIAGPGGNVLRDKVETVLFSSSGGGGGSRSAIRLEVEEVFSYSGGGGGVGGGGSNHRNAVTVTGSADGTMWVQLSIAASGGGGMRQLGAMRGCIGITAMSLRNGTATGSGKGMLYVEDYKEPEAKSGGGNDTDGYHWLGNAKNEVAYEYLGGRSGTLAVARTSAYVEDYQPPEAKSKRVFYAQGMLLGADDEGRTGRNPLFQEASYGGGGGRTDIRHIFSSRGVKGRMRLTSQMNLEFLQLQNQMQMESRQFNSVSNALKVRHDSSMAAIRNMK